MNNSKDLTSTDAVASVPGPIDSTVPTTALVPSLNRRLKSRLHRSRRGFAAGKSRLSLNLDADCTTNGDGLATTSQSTPVSTSSSCSSDVVPWWEVEYQCPPPGHLGAHVVPVSVDEPGTLSPTLCNPNEVAQSGAAKVVPVASIKLAGDQKSDAIRSGVMLYDTPERARRGPYSKLSAIRDSSPCLLVDSSPSQKRKMRSQDAMDCDAALFSSPVTKELKRYHEFRLQKVAHLVTPSTLVRPLTQIEISQHSPRKTQATGAVALENVVAKGPP